MPGSGVLIDGAMQQAPQPGRQAGTESADNIDRRLASRQAGFRIAGHAVTQCPIDRLHRISQSSMVQY
jgi:hypothetical protein